MTVVTLFVVRATAGVLAVGSLFVPWKRQGNGSTFSAAQLATVLSSGPTALPGGRLIAVVVYGVAAAGCVLLGLSGAAGRWATVLRLAVGALLLVMLAAAVSGGWLPFAQWAAGPRLVAAAGALTVVSSLASCRRRPIVAGTS